jgi:hypothetical protein
LGYCYEFEHGTEQDFKEAERLYIKAANNGVGLAMARLAFLRHYGRANVVIDRVEAERWKKKCRSMGAQAVEWIRIAAMEYNITSGIILLILAIYAYGVCFHDGYLQVDQVLVSQFPRSRLWNYINWLQMLEILVELVHWVFVTAKVDCF